MKSIKKSALLCAALVAVMAFAVPSVASAARLEKPAGTLVPTGTTLLLKSSHLRFEGRLFGGAAFTCENVVLTGRVTENSGSSVKAVAAGPGTFSCHSTVPAQYFHIGSIDLLGLSITRDAGGVNHALMGMRVVEVETTEAGTFPCVYEGNEVPLTYTNGASLLHIGGSQNAAFLPGLRGCPKATVSADFSVTDTAGNPIVVN